MVRKRPALGRGWQTTKKTPSTTSPGWHSRMRSINIAISECQQDLQWSLLLLSTGSSWYQVSCKPFCKIPNSNSQDKGQWRAISIPIRGWSKIQSGLCPWWPLWSGKGPPWVEANEGTKDLAHNYTQYQPNTRLPAHQDTKKQSSAWISQLQQSRQRKVASYFHSHTRLV